MCASNELLEKQYHNDRLDHVSFCKVLRPYFLLVESQRTLLRGIEQARMNSNELLLLREKYLCFKQKKDKSAIQAKLVEAIPLPPKINKRNKLPSKEAPRHFNASQGYGGTFEVMQTWSELGI